jgi:hypothetical protein
MYWIWTSEPTAKGEAAIPGGAPIVDRLDVEFETGFAVRRKVPLIEIVRDERSQGTLADSVIVRGAGLLFSSRLRQALASVALDNIQYFPVIVRNPLDGTETDDYHIANIVGRVSCVDRENSVLEMDDEDEVVEFVDVLAIDEAKTNGFDLFRLHEEPAMIIASDRVKEACEAHRITGVQFFDPREYPY